jgi:type VI secretion system protein ImpL
MLGKVFKFLKKAVPGIKSAIPVLLVLIVILLVIAIWWAGPWLQYNEENPLQSVFARSVTTVIFVLSCLAVWGFVQWRKLAGYKDEQERELELQEDPIQRYEERQEEELDMVMKGLKDSLNKRNYMYALPWYLVMGLENAGKTSLINRSGHNFVFSSVMRASGKKTENPYSFDWWIGDDSVLIDPDGELLTQNATSEGENGEMERRLWMNFLQWLEKTRSRRPLNGVVLTLDVAHLISATNSERRAYASLLRARIRELMETLSIRLPVYICLTKLDLLYGFEPFFRHYTRVQREEVMGFTFTMNSVEDLDSWLQEFDTDYQEFIIRINDMLPGALLKCYESEDSIAIYSFCRQMAGLHDVLKRFLEDTLGSDQFSTSALVRGVYFSSVYQQGVPTNAYVDAASRRYGLEHTIHSAQQAKNSTTFFTQNLFGRIIYPEAGIASDNFRVAKKKRQVMLLSTVMCIIVSILLVGSWQRYYMKNVEHADAVLEKVKDYNEKFSHEIIIDSGQNILGPLNAIREATLKFGFFRDKPHYISDMGLYQGHTIGPEVEQTYLSLLESRYLPALMKRSAEDLAAANTDEGKLASLRVFRMLTDKSGRYKGFVENYFARKWQKSYPGNKETQDKLMEHLQYAMKHTDLQKKRDAGDKAAEAVLKPYDMLVADVQNALNKMPVEQRVYRNLKQNASAVLGASLNLATSIGPIYDVVFSTRGSDNSALQIPRLLTRKGYETYFIPKSDSVSELALVDSWVLGQTATINFSEEDKRALREKIRDQYVSDYVNTWRTAMNNIDTKIFRDINSAALVLENITGNSNPFVRLLNVLTENTNLFPPLPDDDRAREEMMTSPRYKVAAMIDKQFAGVNGLIVKDDSKPAYIDEVLEAVTQLQSYLKSIADAPDIGKAALEATKSRVNLNSVDPIYVLQRIATGLPQPFDTMITKMADESWFVVKQEAIKHLEVRWSNDVYKEYVQKFANRYPFNPTAPKDVALIDFESFFGPSGTLSQFYENNLKLFLDENIISKDTEGGSSLIRSDVLDQLATAQRIQRAFFNNKGVLDVEFTLEPVELSPTKRRSIINVDGQFVEYSHGPRKSVELIWPNTLRAASASKLTLIPAEVNKSPRSINIQGPWAFFRLLDEGEIVGTSVTSVDYRFTIDGGTVRYRLYSEADSNPFTSALFRSFRLSPTLY